jgi:serine-type D-Ala-D-Ala carboxypeptidase/endopeptidase (penicillin-binding protein 4)
MHLLFAALALDALFSTATLSGAHTGALVVDAQSGRVLYSRNADDAFIPASTMKLIVGSAALDRLGEAFSFTTSVDTDGNTLYIEGGGDPLLSTADAGDAAAAVKALNMTSFHGGLRAVEGRFRSGVSSRYPDGWQIDDLPYDYAAPVAALSFEENVLHVTLTPGARQGDAPAFSVTPDFTPACLVNAATTGNAQSDDTTSLQISWDASGSFAKDCTIIEGSLPLHGKPVTLDAASLEPPVIALQAFSRAFSEQGITVPMPLDPDRYATAPDDARVLWTHASPRLPDLLRDMWQPSDNLLAETLLMQLAPSGGSALDDTRALGIRAEQEWLQTIGVDPRTLTIVDGSGMSAYDRVTPRALVTILQHDWNAPTRAAVLAALPVAGKSGTLEHDFTQAPLAGNVIAKTGTSNHTRTLAGYVHTPDRTLIFALLVNDWMDSAPGATARLRAFQQAFLTRIREGAAGVP